LSTVELLLFGE